MIILSLVAFYVAVGYAVTIYCTVPANFRIGPHCTMCTFEKFEHNHVTSFYKYTIAYACYTKLYRLYK